MFSEKMETYGIISITDESNPEEEDTGVKTNQSYALLEIAKAFIPLGWLAFGGPAAHIAVFHSKFVVESNWISESVFTELFAISQSLPGPASTQLAYSICLLRGGVAGGLLGFFLWCFPGVLIMIGFAYGVQQLGDSLPTWLQFTTNGLTSAALGLVALAAYKLSSKILTNPLYIAIGVLSASFAINYSQPWLFPLLVFSGGFLTILTHYLEKFLDFSFVLTRDNHAADNSGHNTRLGFYNWKIGISILFIWLILLIIAIIIRPLSNNIIVFNIFSTLYFVGSIIFGGGPVVIPLLQSYVVENNNWMSNQEFLLGLALINSLPGPNFNIGVFCGCLAFRAHPETMWIGGLVGLVSIFSPGLLLMTGLIPLWEKYRKLGLLQIFFRGVNASAVGLVFAAIYILGNKAIVPPGSSVGTIDSIFKYPLYTSIAAISYSLTGFTSLSAPFSIILGGIIGLCDFASKK